MWLVLQSKYLNTSRQRGQTLLLHLNNRVMKADTDLDVLLSKTYQLRDGFSNLDEVVSTERLTTIILDALPAERYSNIKIQATRDPGLSLEDI